LQRSGLSNNYRRPARVEASMLVALFVEVCLEKKGK
jgi:hypothetical protein